ncbi:multicopper oxidase domain-containing protein [bacterium]|nr:multicopper oxidase domain-containing protein [candidate division CSSED10-310 bacterium]
MLIITLLLAGVVPVAAEVFVQCPGDFDGDAVPDSVDPAHPNAVCAHLAAGDGFVNMADGRLQYVFGFSDVTGLPPEQVMQYAMMGANLPAPTISVKEGQELYLTLTNVGMMMRPDLFDPHSVHWHGFANAASIFDGLPETSISVNMGSSLTYYYKVNEPGTYMYHCHVEAAEHMQMGMLGNLYVLPAQNDLPDGTDLAGFTHHTGYTYAYNDGDGSTYYDVDYPIQIAAFDPVFHDASLNVQPLPFALMNDTYPLLNGRGYPDTIIDAPLANSMDGRLSQPVDSLIEAAAGDRILLRISSLSTISYFTLRSIGPPFQVVGKSARILRGPDGRNLYYTSNSVTLGGGESIDAIIDTTGARPGVYFIYASNLYALSNDSEDFGGMMTEIHLY